MYSKHTLFIASFILYLNHHVHMMMVFISESALSSSLFIHLFLYRPNNFGLDDMVSLLQFILKMMVPYNLQMLTDVLKLKVNKMSLYLTILWLSVFWLLSTNTVIELRVYFHWFHFEDPFFFKTRRSTFGDSTVFVYSKL